MASYPKRITCDRILERHTALGRTEVALSRHPENDDLVGVELITVSEDGVYSREWISGLFPKRELSRLASRMMDMLAGVVKAQRAFGLTFDRRFV